MEYNKNMIGLLLYKHLQGTLTNEEQEQLEAWQQAYPDNRLLLEDLKDEDTLAERLAEYHPENRNALRNRILAGIAHRQQQAVPRVRSLRYRWIAAAAAMLLLMTGAYLWTIHKNNTSPSIAITPADIAPGKSGAILTLADNSQVVLDSLHNGVIAAQNGSRVSLKNGQLSYDPTGKSTPATVYNTMTIPRGRQFQLLLPDGTQVWLNSSSSIRFPTVFTGKERQVAITGEVYFEVARNATMPFRVNVGRETNVEVLGTRFNVNAYDNEASINTTLLEGAVRIAAVTLQPGQQAQIISNKRIKIIDDVNIERVMAWKNGLFNFEGARLDEVMRQLARWYDIEVIYEKGIPDIALGGEITKGVSLKGLLVMLERAGVHFRLEGRKLIVLP